MLSGFSWGEALACAGRLYLGPSAYSLSLRPRAWPRPWCCRGRGRMRPAMALRLRRRPRQKSTAPPSTATNARAATRTKARACRSIFRRWPATAICFLSADFPVRVVLFGMKGKIDVNGRTFDGDMPPLNALSDAQIAAVLAYVRGAWGNAALAPADMAAGRCGGGGQPAPAQGRHPRASPRHPRKAQGRGGQVSLTNG